MYASVRQLYTTSIIHGLSMRIKRTLCFWLLAISNQQSVDLTVADPLTAAYLSCLTIDSHYADRFYKAS